MSLHYRKYRDYHHYKMHQMENLKVNHTKFSKAFDQRYRRIHKRITDVLGFLANVNKDAKILCLGARLGEEVKAFRTMGFPAIGIDLYPGKNNPYVVAGDFHNLEEKDNSIGGIYTNALDHAFDIEKIATECARVLSHDGFLLLDISTNKRLTDKKHFRQSNHESMVWDSIEELIKIFLSNGFVEVGRNMESDDVVGKPFLGIIFKKEN